MPSRRSALLCSVLMSFAACDSHEDDCGCALPARTWALGFSPTPPVLTTESVLHGIDLWSQRSEYAVVHEELPWTDLLAGMPPIDILERDKVELVSYLRARGQGLVFMADLTDGLSRAEEAPQLRALNRSLGEPAVQNAARAYVLAVAAVLQPDWIGLAAETNLIRAAAPAPLYGAVVATANAMAADLTTANATAWRFYSVQVETAWGLLGGTGAFVGIEQDLADFPFADAIGLSSYPYFVFDDPSQIPDDWYLRVLAPTSLPAFVAEGGWSSAAIAGNAGSPDQQARWVVRQGELLDGMGALMWLHLLFADPDLATWPQPIPPNLPLFTSIGLTDSAFSAKPALFEWDALFARPLLW